MENKIKFELETTNFYTRWPCHICGGNTEKTAILCESKEGPFKLTRICERCLKHRNFDERLKKNIQGLREFADVLETMAGRIEAPTYKQWQDAEKQHDDEFKKMMGGDDGISF